MSCYISKKISERICGEIASRIYRIFGRKIPRKMQRVDFIKNACEFFRKTLKGITRNLLEKFSKKTQDLFTKKFHEFSMEIF